MRNIILLHGALGVSQDLQALGNALKKLGLNVYSFSFSGHGKTAYKKDFDIDQFSFELEHFIIKNEIAPVDIFGYSMGGYAALNLALKQNHLINKIITLGTKFDWSEVSAEKEIKQLNPEIIKDKIPSFASLLKEKHGENWEELLYKTSELLRNITLIQHLNSKSLKLIENPVLLGIADKDQMVSLDETLAVLKILPRAGIFMLPFAKHQFETANLNILSVIINEFLHPKN